MLRLGCKRTLAFVLRRHHDVARWSSTSAHQPNAPLDLDPAFQALLKDVEMSLRNKVKSDASGSHGPRELEVYPHDPEAPVDYLSSAELDAQDEGFGHKERRKSPAAHFGSQRIGAVVLPFELESTIGRMVAGECPMSIYLFYPRLTTLKDSDKSTLHQDAKRLFFVETNQRPEWDPTYNVKYKSGRAAGKHSLRDATAFATVALPSHYAAIYAVLDHVKQRLGPEWQVERVIDWGAATGSGLWLVLWYCKTHCMLLMVLTGHLVIRSKGTLTNVIRLIWPKFRSHRRASAVTLALTNERGWYGLANVSLEVSPPRGSQDMD